MLLLYANLHLDFLM